MTDPEPGPRSAPITVRPATATDQPAIREIVLQAFGPGPDRVPDPVSDTTGHEVVVADLVEALRAEPGCAAREWVAERDGGLVGHILISTSLLDAPRRLVDVRVLSPLAVRPGHQRIGIGAALISAAVDGVGAEAGPALFLEGDPAYYSRRGFVAGGPLGFRRPSLRIPEPAFQVILLPAHEPWMVGTLVYAWPFWALDCVGLRE